MARYPQKLGLAAFLIVLLGMIGCGETIRGISKDAMRVGRGIKTIFVSD